MEGGQRVSKYMYLLAAVLDCEANFLVLEAYNYTSITSVMLLDCFTIPCAMVLSAIFLKCRSGYTTFSCSFKKNASFNIVYFKDIHGSI